MAEGDGTGTGAAVTASSRRGLREGNGDGCSAACPRPVSFLYPILLPMLLSDAGLPGAGSEGEGAASSSPCSARPPGARWAAGTRGPAAPLLKHFRPHGQNGFDVLGKRDVLPGIVRGWQNSLTKCLKVYGSPSASLGYLFLFHVPCRQTLDQFGESAVRIKPCLSYSGIWVLLLCVGCAAEQEGEVPPRPTGIIAGITALFWGFGNCLFPAPQTQHMPGFAKSLGGCGGSGDLGPAHPRVLPGPSGEGTLGISFEAKLFQIFPDLAERPPLCFPSFHSVVYSTVITLMSRAALGHPSPGAKRLLRAPRCLTPR